MTEDNLQLQQQIKREFLSTYSDKICSILAEQMMNYFKFHQFDEWKDIFDDINNGYDDCCCKQVLFEQLNITNIEQKRTEYQRLKKCIIQPQTITIHSLLHNKIFDKIFKDIKTAFIIVFDTNTAQNILQLLIFVLNNEGFEDYESVMDDIENIDNSTIISYIIDNIDYNTLNSTHNSNYHIIANGIKYIIEGKMDQFLKQYDAKSFDFKITIEDVKQTSAFLKKHSNLMRHCKAYIEHVTDYLSSDPIIQSNKYFDSKSSPSLLISKSIDYKNNKPILFWLFKLYLKKLNDYLKLEIPYRKGYPVTSWFKNNKYTQWLTYAHPIAAENIKLGLIQLCKHYLQPPNIFNWTSHTRVICDRLDAFVEYALVFHEIAHTIKQKIRIKEFSSPIQIDYWIIPQMTREINVQSPWPYNMEELWDVKKQHNVRCIYLNDFKEVNKYTEYMVFGYIRHVESLLRNSSWSYRNIPTVIYQICALFVYDYLTRYKDTNYKYNKLCSSDTLYHLQIENCLTDNKVMYVKGKDFFVMDAPHQFEQLKMEMINMIKQYDNWKESLNRFIFIIDRRHPYNLSETNEDFIIPPIYREKSEKIFKDKIYMIAPKQYQDEFGMCICPICKSNCERGDMFCDGCVSIPAGIKSYFKLSTKSEVLPEDCWNLSKVFMLFSKGFLKPISMNHAMNGYMFGLSYHILSEDNISAYFYHKAGGTVFDIKDVDKLWPSFFDKINDKQQQLSDENKKQLEEIEKLPNVAFENFERQCNNI